MHSAYRMIMLSLRVGCVVLIMLWQTVIKS